MTSPELLPDEIILEPDDYELPEHLARTSDRMLFNKRKVRVKVTRKQIQYFGERGIPWLDIEKFFGVDRITLMRNFKPDYDKGIANTNIALRNKMVELALSGNPTMLIWLGKNRLQMSDDGPTVDADTGKELSKKSDEQLEKRALELAEMVLKNAAPK